MDSPLFEMGSGVKRATLWWFVPVLEQVFWRVGRADIRSVQGINV